MKPEDYQVLEIIISTGIFLIVGFGLMVLIAKCDLIIEILSKKHLK